MGPPHIGALGGKDSTVTKLAGIEEHRWSTGIERLESVNLKWLIDGRILYPLPVWTPVFQRCSWYFLAFRKAYEKIEGAASRNVDSLSSSLSQVEEAVSFLWATKYLGWRWVFSPLVFFPSLATTRVAAWGYKLPLIGLIGVKLFPRIFGQCFLWRLNLVPCSMELVLMLQSLHQMWYFKHDNSGLKAAVNVCMTPEERSQQWTPSNWDSHLVDLVKGGPGEYKEKNQR